MRDKIVFFILGAMLATIAYAVGNYANTVEADNSKKGTYGFLSVSHLEVDSMRVAENVHITKSDILISDPKNPGNLIRISIEQGIPHISLQTGDGEKSTSHIMLIAKPMMQPLLYLGSDDGKKAYGLTSEGVVPNK